MACPTCGSSNREPIAPGHWRCTGIVDDLVGGPGLAGDRLGPPVIRQGRICGARYAEGPPVAGVPMCSCRTFAIGECSACGVAVCGDHSGMLNQRRFCGRCLPTERSNRARASAANRREVERLRVEAQEEAREQAQQAEKVREAEYAALPAMNQAQAADYLRGRLDDGPASGYRLPVALGGAEMRAVLALVPPTFTVVTRRWWRFDLQSQPGWRAGTQSRHRGTGRGAGTGHSAVALFADGSTATVAPHGGGRWIATSPLSAGTWRCNTESLRELRAALRFGTVVPEFRLDHTD